MLKNQASFTLIELLIIIGILAVLASVTVLILNPVEMARGSRDSIRLNSLSSLNTALGIFSVNKPGSFMGTSNTVYISVPYASADCGYGAGNPLNLPSIPAGWSYACQTEANYRNVGGSGWIPINFSSLSYGAPFTVLPVDPINNASSQYYTYVTGGSWELTALLESGKYKIQAGKDGGVDPAMYEVGNSLALSPFVRALAGNWTMDEASGPATNDSSGNGHNGTLINGTTWAAGKVGSALNFDGVNDYADFGHINLTGNQVTVSWWMNVIDNSGLTPSDNFAPVIIDWMKGGASSYTDGTVLCYIKTNPGWSGGNYATNGVLCAYSSSDAQLNDVGTNFSNWYGSWHNVTYTVNGTAAKIYVDGVLENSIVGPGNISPENETFTIDRRNWNYGVDFHGTIDETRIYNRALTDEEILAIYNATK